MSSSQNKKNNRLATTAVLMAVIALNLIVILIVLAFLFAPKTTIPEFEITDQGGEWRTQGKIAVFDDKINPGSEGSYQFVIKNESDEKLTYGFRLSEYLGNFNQNSKPFMQYRLKVDNVPVEQEWQYAGLDYTNIEILPAS